VHTVCPYNLADPKCLAQPKYLTGNDSTADKKTFTDSDRYKLSFDPVSFDNLGLCATHRLSN
jgi:hypothetical protein